jgi:putative ATP-dependent endonuclease of OLD family
VTEARSNHFDVFFSDPTLEPAITPGNEDTVRVILEAMGVAEADLPDDDDLPMWITDWLKKKGKGRKARFADRFAAECRDPAMEIVVPDHLEDLLEFVWDGFLPPEEAEADDESDTGEE